MIYRGKVTNISDPEDLGRIIVQVRGFERQDNENLTGWAWPVFPLAGSARGSFWLPKVDDEVYVMETAEGDWIWLGGFYTKQHARPADADEEVRIIKTPGGHQVKFDDDGDIEIESKDGATITLEDGGNIVIDGADEIHLNGTDGGGVVMANCACWFTGGVHLGALKVKGSKLS